MFAVSDRAVGVDVEDATAVQLATGLGADRA